MGLACETRGVENEVASNQSISIRPCDPTQWLFPFSLQMSVSTWHRKVQTNTMKAYQKQQQFMYHHCELCHVTPENALVIAVCILMLPMVQLTAEHAQLATTYHMTPADQWLVHRHDITICHNPLVHVVLSSLSNVLPMMVLQNSIVSSFPLNTSSHFSENVPGGRRVDMP